MGPATTSDELLSLRSLSRFDVRLAPESWNSLLAEPKTWVAGDFEYDGVVYDNVGVRLKGNHSFRPLDEKPSLKIKFNKYQPGRRFLGLEGLTLNNLVVDASMLREWVSYRVFREIGVPAPRAGYAEVWVNDERYGLYLTLEPYDDEFLERVYSDPSGNLYESDTSADLHKDIESWDQDEGTDKSRDDLTAFGELAQRDGNAVFYGSEAAVDMPKFLNFLAGEAIVGHFDGHMGGHNFFVYHEPSLDLWSYQPWGLDQGLVRRVSPYDHNGYLGAKCLHDAQCLVDYIQTSQQALLRLTNSDLDAEIDRAIALTDDAMRADERKPYAESKVETWRAKTRGYIAGRPDELEPQFDCLVNGAEPDVDGDGYGSCFEDCDDNDKDLNPAAAETCDGIDNDCSGYADDVPACECPSVSVDGRTFYLCTHRIRWVDARDFCVEQGHVLAQFDSSEQLDEVWLAATEAAPGRWAIGLNDREDENEYRWIDGSAPSFSYWADGQPAHQLDWFDCVFLRGKGEWHEDNCIEQGAFICTDP
ncbi:MAG: CotH kinase family protein [Nannocystaceae bacterium]|nr:CotH kinase family protein [Nannocystaceae bacterium]